MTEPNGKPPEQAPQAEKSKLKSLAKGTAIAFCVVVAVLAVLWYFLKPTGQLRLAIDPAESEKAAQEATARDINSQFDSANRIIGDVMSFHDKLGLGKSKIDTDPVPGRPGPLSVVLSDVVSLESTFDFDWKVVKFKGEFKGNKIMDAAYGWAGWYDYYVVVKDYAPCGSAQAAKTVGTDCHQMNLTVWPIDRHGVFLYGSPDELKGNLAIYLFKAFLRRDMAEKRNVNKTALPPEEITDDFASLAVSAQGLDVLEQGTFHARCINARVEECRQIAATLFEQALSRDGDNSYASFGMGLLKLREALDAARGDGRVLSVLSLLNKAGRYLGGAIAKSTILTDFISQKDSFARFRLVNLADFRVNADFLASIAEYSEAYRAYVEANYVAQLEHSKRVTNIPDDLQIYLRGFEYEARLDLVNSPEEAAHILVEFAELIKRAPDTWLYNIVYASQACRFGLVERAWEPLERALNAAGGDIALFHDAYVWKAYCLAAAQQYDKADQLIEKVEKFLGNPAPDSQSVQTVYVDLGYYYAFTHQYQKAAASFENVATDRCFWQRIIHDRQLEEFRKSEEFSDLRSKVVVEQSQSRNYCDL